jgi:hypothetical protein
MLENAALGVAVVDQSKPPGRDESSFLAALLTAVCRPSLHLAPGLLLRAASMSGAGAGKGLLARCICIIAFGREPPAITAGGTAEELEKRIAAQLIEGGPVLFLDNLNNTAVRSSLLASVITERPARVRLLGKSQMMALNTSALVILTGNGLSVSEDLARRFITVDLDPGTENPETRPFTSDIRAEVTARRNELLGALLTIWRWGKLTRDVKPGRPLGSFAQWCQWVRDPLVALGCQDPVERVSEAKERDVHRQLVTELFEIWWDKHRDRPMPIRRLADEVKRVADPHNRGRQYLASYLERLAGIRIAGFQLTRQASAGKWGSATYALREAGTGPDHRDHRGHRAADQSQDHTDGPYDPYDDSEHRKTGAENDPKNPMTPMPSAIGGDANSRPNGSPGSVHGGHRDHGSGIADEEAIHQDEVSETGPFQTVDIAPATSLSDPMPLVASANEVEAASVQVSKFWRKTV